MVLTGRFKIGIVAGDKNLPFLIRDFAKQNDTPVVIVGIKGSVKNTLFDGLETKNYREFFITELSKTITFFKERKVDAVVIVGGVNKAKFKFTFDFVRMFFKLLFIKNKYDGILRLVISEFEKAGLKVLGIQDLMPHLLVEKGVLTDVLPSSKDMEDIKFGVPEAVKFAETDKGQSVIVKDGKILATERFSGTDDLIRRASKIKNSKGAILVKVVKPQQELRADIPVLGVETIKSLSRAKFSGVVVQAGGAIIDNEKEVIAEANKHNIFILGK